ncbi:MAG: hypothetical protein JWL70_2777 [Acidimicrobiia bacterium]|nr:hypothetical protein [Acidimicrobiia bacterium]
MTGFSVERDDASASFFDAAAAGRLMIRRCPVCGTAYPPYQRRCPDGTALEWEQASGRAALVTWAVDHGPVLDPTLAAADGTVSIFGLVELEEGPWLQVPLVGVEVGELSEGIPMRVEFVRPGNGEAIPAFTRP